jgi:hypothetical protein
MMHNTRKRRPRPGCRRSSYGNAPGRRDHGEGRATSAGLAPAGSPSVRGFRVPASAATREHGQPFFPVELLPVHLPAPPVRAGCAGDGSQIVDVPTTACATGFVARCHPDGWIDSDGLTGRCPPDGRHDAANTPSRSWPRSRRISFAGEQTNLKVRTSQGSRSPHFCRKAGSFLTPCRPSWWRECGSCFWVPFL